MLRHFSVLLSCSLQENIDRFSLRETHLNVDDSRIRNDSILSIPIYEKISGNLTQHGKNLLHFIPRKLLLVYNALEPY